jgi:hypothetical protein
VSTDPRCCCFMFHHFTVKPPESALWCPE